MRKNRTSRFRKAESDRSGFDYKKILLVNDKGSQVGLDEYDEPPPSKIPLGGEGEISDDGIRATTSLTIDTERDNPTILINSTNGIQHSFVHPYMRIAGSNAAIDIAANPQITAGQQDDVLTLYCVGSDITLDHGTGLNMMNSANFTMTSGSVIGFIYTTGGTVWNETFRIARGGFAG